MAQSHNNTINNNNSYANRLKNSNKKNTIRNINYPKRDQSILLTAHDEIQIKDYLSEIAKYIEPSKIIGISRIGQGKICMYLDSKETADFMLQEHKYISVTDKLVELEKRDKPTTKVIIHCCLSLPNEIIEAKFRELNIKTDSPITFLRIGIQDERFKNILSFKRQIFIIKDDETYLPDYLNLHFENQDYRVYLSEDIICSYCHRHGHSDKECYQKNPPLPQQNIRNNQQVTQQPSTSITPTNNNSEEREKEGENSEKQIQIRQENHQEDETEKVVEDEEKEETSTHAPQDYLTHQEPTQQLNTRIKTFLTKTFEQRNQNTGIKPQTNPSEPQTAEPEPSLEAQHFSKLDYSQQHSNNTSNAPIKRSAPNLHSSNESILSQDIQTSQEKKKRFLSPNNQEDINIAELIKPLEEEMRQNPNQYVLNYENLLDLLENIQGSNDQINIVRQYTEDVESLIKTLKDPSIKQKNKK